MGKASSAKKIERVQRAGVARTAGTRRPLGFPLAVVAIIVLGTVGVAFARKSRVDSELLAPTVGDTWHIAYGTYKCDSYLPDPQAKNESNLLGITTYGDGLITVKPATTASSGKNAVFGKFADQIGMVITENPVKVKMADGTELNTGDKCKDSKGKDVESEVVMFVWPPQSTKSTTPEIIRTGLAGVRFAEDQQIMAVALVPKGTKTIDLPSTTALKNPRTSTPSTTAPGTTAPATSVAPTTAASPTTTAKPKGK